jgi:hypothetical protein
MSAFMGYNNSPYPIADFVFQKVIEKMEARNIKDLPEPVPEVTT